MAHPRLSVLNDTHVGTLRSAGTTVMSAWQLRQYLLADFGHALDAIDNDLLINGDLFDKESIPLHDLLATAELLRQWLEKGHKLWLSPGNHDLSKTSTTLSSFQFLARLLEAMRSNVKYIPDLTEIYPGYWVLPHLANQDLLNAKLAKVPECEMLFVHTNYDNKFAVESDHSLNISKEQAEDCKAKFIIFGHEHQQRTALGGKVVIPGNQTPSSVSDCLGCEAKFMVQVDMATHQPELVELAPLSFVEMDWRELGDSDAKFIRVTGTASAEEGAEVTQALSKYRNKSQALVITNAVQITRADGEMESLSESLENVTAFDVMAALKELLTPEEVAAIEALP